MAKYKFGSVEYYKEHCDFLSNTLHEKGLQIVELQEKCASLQERLDGLASQENFLNVTKDFFNVLLKSQTKTRNESAGTSKPKYQWWR